MVAAVDSDRLACYWLTRLIPVFHGWPEEVTNVAWILVIVAMFVDLVRTGRRLKAVVPLLGFSAGFLVIGFGMGAILSVLHF